MAGATGPLAGLRVLDLTRLLPGPWCSMMLADLGAEVLKIEHPNGGDNSRAASPRYQGAYGSESVYFCTLNRNKRSLALDLKQAADHARFLALAREAHVVVESFRPGVADRLGIGYAALRALNPDLVYCALSGYGQTGPRAHLPGHDLNIAGLSGLLQLTPGQPPAMPGMVMGDYAGGAMALIGILAAVAGRQGAFIDASMLDGLIGWTGVQMTGVFARHAGPAAGSEVEGWGGNPRYGLYRTKDGRYLTVSLLEKHFWEAFCRHVDRTDLIDPNETEADRLTSHGERGPLYRESLTSIFASRDRAAWVSAMETLGIPICPVLTPEEVYCAAPAAGRGWFDRVDMPGLNGSIPQMGFPFQMQMADGSNGLSLRRPPPALDEANGDTSREGAWPS
jgi:crotonobetainyl-CoA:carnitine CoA-transferase CaiB-like acyl-CoA transferase